MKVSKILIVTLLIGITTFAQAHYTEQFKQVLKKEINFNTYESIKYGFKFQYPDTWILDNKLGEVINLRNEVTSIIVNFVDTNTGFHCSLEYFLGPIGKSLYDYSYSQLKNSEGIYVKNKRLIHLNGKEAIETNFESNTDGKGNQLKHPITNKIVEFLDNKKSGEFRFHFQSSTFSKTQKGNIYSLLSSFSTFSTKL